jgi:hypothetical protein
LRHKLSSVLPQLLLSPYVRADPAAACSCGALLGVTAGAAGVSQYVRADPAGAAGSGGGGALGAAAGVAAGAGAVATGVSNWDDGGC